MNLKKIFDSINKSGDEITCTFVFRNFPSKQIDDLEGRLIEIMDGWTEFDEGDAEFGKSSVSFASSFGWSDEETINMYGFSTESPLDIRPGTEQEWVDSLAERIAGICYVDLKAIPVDFVLYLSYYNKEGELKTYNCHFEV